MVSSERKEDATFATSFCHVMTVSEELAKQFQDTIAYINSSDKIIGQIDHNVCDNDPKLYCGNVAKPGTPIILNTVEGIVGREYENIASIPIYADSPLSGDMPSYYSLPSNSKLCGYISPDGKYYECETCQHQEVVVDIANENGYNGEIYENKPIGMCDEEYFLMRRRSFVKISSFKGLPENMYQFRYGTLTPEQTEILFPR